MLEPEGTGQLAVDPLHRAELAVAVLPPASIIQVSVSLAFVAVTLIVPVPAVSGVPVI